MKQIQMSAGKYIQTCFALSDLGWQPVGEYHKREMKFSRNGKIYDLSAADLTQLDRIEREGLFVIDNSAK